jgi:hypothetical protein
MFPSQMTSELAHHRGRDDRERAADHRRAEVRWRVALTGRLGEARR